MKATRLLSILLLFTSINAFGQTFGWNDKVFHVNAVKPIHIKYALDRAELPHDCFDSLDDIDEFDTIVRFLKANPLLKVQVINYTLIPANGTRLDWYRAYIAVRYLRQVGIDSARLKPMGMGYKREYIDKLKTQREKDSVRNGYKRQELKIVCNCYGHETFNWNDSVFYVGSKRKIGVSYSIDNGRLNPSARDTLNVLVAFMKKHPNIKIEIDCHSDQQGSLAHNTILTKVHARACADYLISQGIDSARLVPKGYWFSQPIIPQYQIDQMKTQQEKDAAYAINRRTEVVIIEE